MLTFPWIAQSASFDKELQCLSLNIYHEARGEPSEGQLAVAYVTMNRVTSGRYPKSVCNVVWQSKQFSWTHDGISDTPREGEEWERAKRIAAYVYKNYHMFQRLTRGATDLTRGALYYYAPKKANPAWASKKYVTLKIGSHVFLKDFKG